MIQSIAGPSFIQGKIIAPPSKSHAQRILACSLITNGIVNIKNFGGSSDEKASLSILKDLGLKIQQIGNQLIIYGKGFNPNRNLTIQCNESGLAARMFTPILSNSQFEVNIHGSGTLLKRSMSTMEEIMVANNVSFQSNEGKLPFHLKGPLKPKNIIIDGSFSSQYITGFILAYVASSETKNQTIEIDNPKSLPYIELTLDVLKNFGVNLKIENNKIQFNGPYKLKNTNIVVEGDWSSASFFMVAAAINGNIGIEGLNIDSKQADVRILQALKDFGAEITNNSGTLCVQTKDKRAFHFDATDCPDLFPPLSVLACFAEGQSTIKGVSRLFQKESNRAKSIIEELNKMGADIKIINDHFVIQGVRKSNAASVDSHHDHRIAMACAVMALHGEGITTISNSNAVNKSFPDFFNTFKKLIASIK